MSGHSKWSTIKRKKSKTDAERGKIFTKLIKEITVAARDGGGDENANPRLRTAIITARTANMPLANIERAIKKGTGELPGVNYESSIYEGYGPGGVAIIVDCLTDNRNRTIPDIRHIFSKNKGNLAENGAVVWMFGQKGLIVVDRGTVDEDDLTLLAADAGAEDVRVEEDSFEIITSVEDFEKVKKALDENKIAYSHAELTRIPQTTIRVEGKEAEQVLRLVEELEDHEDIQKVFSNFDIDEEVLASLAA